MAKLYKVIVDINNLGRTGEDWKTTIYVRAYQAVKKAKVTVVNQIREGIVESGRGRAQHLKPADIDSIWVNENKFGVTAGVWCSEEQVDDYISILKHEVDLKLNKIINFWTQGEASFVINKDKVKVLYMENQ